MSGGVQDENTPPSTPGRARRRSLTENLRHAAILEVGGLHKPGDHNLPREIAVAFLDERQTLAWLVALEPTWRRSECDTNPATESTVLLTKPGGGQAPDLVARDLAEAVRGHRVYAIDPMATGRWTRLLYAAASGVEPPFIVRDLFKLVGPFHALAPELEGANHAAHRIVPNYERAAADAARHAMFVKALAVRVKVRMHETASFGANSYDAAVCVEENVPRRRRRRER